MAKNVQHALRRLHCVQSKSGMGEPKRSIFAPNRRLASLTVHSGLYETISKRWGTHSGRGAPKGVAQGLVPPWNTKTLDFEDFFS